MMHRVILSCGNHGDRERVDRGGKGHVARVCHGRGACGVTLADQGSVTELRVRPLAPAA